MILQSDIEWRSTNEYESEQDLDDWVSEPQMTSIPFVHLERLLSDYGLWQHCEGAEPHRRHGYSIDDEARAVIVAAGYRRLGMETPFLARMGETCFRYIQEASIPAGESAGKFHNFLSESGEWLDSVGSEDSLGRTIWGLGAAYASAPPWAPRQISGELISRALPHVTGVEHLRAKAFALLGLAESRFSDGIARKLADELADSYESVATGEWRWFEPSMTYCNARLPHALFAASRLFPSESRYREIAESALCFLLTRTRTGKNGYAPVGNERMGRGQWFKSGDRAPAQFDQQPVDAGALVECCAEAFLVTGEPGYREAMHKAFGWYVGENVHNISVVNMETGGVSDAITRYGLNRNQGAESVLSIHMAYLAMKAVDL